MSVNVIINYIMLLYLNGCLFVYGSLGNLLLEWEV